MTKYKGSPGYCTYCQRRVWASRSRHIIGSWRCTTCGSLVKITGDYAVQQHERTLLGPSIANYPVGETSRGSPAPFVLQAGALWAVFALAVMAMVIYVVVPLL